MSGCVLRESFLRHSKQRVNGPCSVACFVSVFVTDWSLDAKEGVPLLCRLAAWSSLALPLCILSSGTMIAERGAAVALCLLPAFAITSLTHEVYFYCALVALLITWCHVESKRRKVASTAMPTSVDMTKWCFNDYRIGTEKAKEKVDFNLTLRTATLYLALALYAFLGTGNIASLNSFDPSFIRLFVTQFRPWLMMTLLIYKCLVPFIVLSLTLHTVHVLRAQYADTLTQLILVLLMMSDVLTMVALKRCTKRDTLPCCRFAFFAYAIAVAGWI